MMDNLKKVFAVFASCIAVSVVAAPSPISARSVHMWHPTPDVEWVYGEVTVEKSVPGSYFAAICFSCGYCGIQELYDGKKVAIFSVWDPGDPFDFKAKADGVDEKVRTKNLYAGEGVTISRFGGEGTGGKSLMPFDWKIGETYRFALHAKQDGDYRTAFSAYLFRDGAWFKIATFTTLQTKGAHAIKNVYSFVEDFRRNEESRGQVRRARFTNFFAKPIGGEWKAIEDGRFTADKNPIMTIDAEVVENGFALTTGGDTENINIKLLAGAKTTVGPRPEPCCALDALVPPVQVLFKSNDTVEGVKNAVYRIPALCTAPNGDLIAACDARRQNGGDLNVYQPINIAVRRSSDGGKTWSEPVNSWIWQWDDNEKWAGSDPSFVVDAEAKKIFLFYNVWKWEDVKNWDNNVYRFYVQESSDDGKTWSKPRDISADIAFPEWPFGKRRNAGGFIFISSGSGAQMKDGTLLHTLVHVNDGNALFGSDDHGKTWKSFGKPVRSGDECKVVELSDGSWMINSRWHGGGRQIHVSKDRGKTWESHYDTLLADPQCNAQIMRYGNALLFSNCKSPNRRALLYLRASVDDGKTWNYGLCIEPKGAAYSDMTILPNGDVGILYEGAGYATINFTTVPLADIKAQVTTPSK